MRKLLTRAAAPAFTLAALGFAWLHPSQAFAQAQQVPIPEQPSTAPQIEIAGTGVVPWTWAAPETPRRTVVKPAAVR